MPPTPRKKLYPGFNEPCDHHGGGTPRVRPEGTGFSTGGGTGGSPQSGDPKRGGDKRPAGVLDLNFAQRSSFVT